MNLSRREFGKRTSLGLMAAATVGGAAATGCPTLAQWEAIVIADLPAIIQVLAQIFAIAGDPSVSAVLEAQVKNITTLATADINLINTLVLNYQAKPSASLLQEIDNVLADAQENLSALLAAFHVSNPVLMTTISAVLGVAISAVTGLMVIIPPPPQPSALRLYVAYDSGGNAIRQAYNTIVGPNYPAHLIR